MSEPDSSLSPPEYREAGGAPYPQMRRWRGPSLVWIVPIVALVVGLSLFVRSILTTGPTITIEFQTADGLKPGQTEVRYKEVSVGKVETVALSKDRQKVQATVRLVRSAASLAVEDSRFWIVKPRIDLGGVSGLETLFSGSYIGVDAGVSKKTISTFEGLQAPPFVLRDEPGRSYALSTDDLGSLDVGSPIYYRRTRVGRVVGYKLDHQADQLAVQVFIESPYDSLVTVDTRFWNASGVDLSLNAGGLTLNTQTLASVLAGGMAFERLPDSANETPAPDGYRFDLFASRKAALAPPDGPPLAVRMVFDQSVRGLAIGSPVDFLGIDIGKVKSIGLNYDPASKKFPIEVQAEIYPLRLGAARDTLVPPDTDPTQRDALVLKRLVEHGVRAQARSGNLITGQMFVALDFIPRPGRASLDTRSDVLTIPTVPGTFSELQPQIAEIVSKINRVPFDEIGRNLNTTLQGATTAISKLTPDAQAALADVRATLAEVQKTMGSARQSLGELDRNLLGSDAPIQRNAEQTMLDLQRAANSLRTLTDYLERNPESLLRGKPADAPIAPPSTR